MRQEDVAPAAVLVVLVGRMHDVASQQSSKLNNATLVATMTALPYTQRNSIGLRSGNRFGKIGLKARRLSEKQTSSDVNNNDCFD